MKNFNNKNKIGLTIGIAATIYFFCFSFVFASSITSESIINLANKDRITQNMGILNESSTLDEAASEKVADMFKNNYFAHTSPQGLSPWYWFEKNGYDYTYAGENLAIGFSSAESEETAWMNSPEHRKNILNPNYQEIGAAVMSGEINGEVATIAVQLFGTRAKGGQTVVKGSATENLNDKLMPGNTQNLHLPVINNQTKTGVAQESFVAKAADFV